MVNSRNIGFAGRGYTVAVKSYLVCVSHLSGVASHAHNLEPLLRQYIQCLAILGLLPLYLPMPLSPRVTLHQHHLKVIRPMLCLPLLLLQQVAMLAPLYAGPHSLGRGASVRPSPPPLLVVPPHAATQPPGSKQTYMQHNMQHVINARP